MAYRGPIVAPSGARQPCALAALSPSPRMPAGPHRTPGRGPPTRPHRPPPACCPRLRLPGTPPAPSPNDPCHSHVDPTAATARRRAPPAPLTRARWKSWCARRTASTRRWGRWCGTTWSERGRGLPASRAGADAQGGRRRITAEALGATRAVRGRQAVSRVLLVWTGGAAPLHPEAHVPQRVVRTVFQPCWNRWPAPSRIAPGKHGRPEVADASQRCRPRGQTGGAQHVHRRRALPWAGPRVEASQGSAARSATSAEQLVHSGAWARAARRAAAGARRAGAAGAAG